MDDGRWVPNPNYQRTRLDVRRRRNYADLGFVQGVSLYDQAVRDLDRFAWVSKPALCGELESLRAVRPIRTLSFAKMVWNYFLHMSECP